MSLAEWFGSLFVLPAVWPLISFRHDAANVVESMDWRLEKFDGEPPLPGENKLPVEIIEGGDNKPTTVRRLTADGVSYVAVDPGEN